MKRTIGIGLAALACTAVVGTALFFGLRGRFTSPTPQPNVGPGPAKTGPDDDEATDPKAYQPAPVTLSAASSFLFSGKPPRQVDAQKHALQRRRAAVLRGRVLTADGMPLSGVEIAAPAQPEVGRTHTDADGFFDFAVNGGGPVVVSYAKNGFLPAQRQVAVPWQDYTWLPEVILVPPGGKAGVLELPVDPSAPIASVVHGARVEDADGPRTATLIAPPGFSANLLLSAGISKPLNRLNLAVTEYTVGPRGASAPPAMAPPGAGCVYAVNIAADEEREPGAQETRFRRSLIHYVENFVKLPVGAALPAFRYDPEKAAWAPGTPGLVIQIVDVKDGLADLDLDGKGMPADAAALAALDVGEPERRRLAALYPKDTTLWRLPLTALGTWGVFLPVRPPDGAVAPPSAPAAAAADSAAGPQPPRSAGPPPAMATASASVAIPGTDLRLCYSSDRSPGTKAPYKMDIMLSGPDTPKLLKRIDLEIQIAGRRIAQSFPPQAGQKFPFAWDGLDAYGRPVAGRRPATVRVGYVYDAMPPARQECVLWREQCLLLGQWDARADALGGWTLNVHHYYDPIARVVYLGDGSRREAAGLPPIITTVAGGTGVLTYNDDGQPATLSNLSLPRGLAIGPDGSIYIADAGQNRVRRVGPDGLISTVAGTGRAGFDRDDGVARDEPLHTPTGLAIAADGSLYIGDDLNRKVRRLLRDGGLTTVLGGGDKREDGALARASQIGLVRGLAVGPGGALYVAQNSFYQCVLAVTPNGVVRYIAGVPAGKANLDTACGVAIAPDGTLYVSDADGCRVWRVGIDGAVTIFAGTGKAGFSGDGGPAVNAMLHTPSGLAVGPDGSLYIADAGNQRIRRVAPDGVISTFVGVGKSGSRETGDGGPASKAVLRLSEKVEPGQARLCGIAVGPDGDLFIADVGHSSVRRVAPAFSGISDSEILITSDNGAELYVFDGLGRHLKTLDAATGALLYRFVYDAAGRLTEVHDRAGGMTRVERDKAGRPRALVSPDGQRTALELGGDGRLNRVGVPTGEPAEMEYDTGGLLTSFKDAEGRSVHFRYDDEGRPARE
jgi:YD repeat-containing protein